MPNMEAQKSGGGGGLKGLLLNIAANYIYDAITGNKVQVTPPMDGKITASPKVEAFGGFRIEQTINGYASDGLRPDIDGDNPPGYNDDKWTEYFNVDFNEVVDNPDYDPDAEPGEPNSREYILPSAGEFNDHGDECKSRGTMKREYSTAKQGYFFLDDGHRYIDFTKKGRWVYTGESEKIKCYHRLLNEVKVGDNRLAKSQTYKARLRWQLERLSWSKDEEDFVHNGFSHWKTEDHTLSATSSSRTIAEMLKENTRIYKLEEKGSSQLY